MEIYKTLDVKSSQAKKEQIKSRLYLRRSTSGEIPLKPKLSKAQYQTLLQQKIKPKGGPLAPTPKRQLSVGGIPKDASVQGKGEFMAARRRSQDLSASKQRVSTSTGFVTMSPLGPSLHRIRSLDRGNSEFDIVAKKKQFEKENAHQLRNQIIIRKTKHQKADLEKGQQEQQTPEGKNLAIEATSQRKTRSVSNFANNRKLESGGATEQEVETRLRLNLVNKLRGENSMRLSTGFIIKKVMNRQSLQQQAQRQLSLKKKHREHGDDQESFNLDSQRSSQDVEQKHSSIKEGLAEDGGQDGATESDLRQSRAKASKAGGAGSSTPKAGAIIDRALKNIFNDSSLTQSALQEEGRDFAFELAMNSKELQSVYKYTCFSQMAEPRTKRRFSENQVRLDSLILLVKKYQLEQDQAEMDKKWLVPQIQAYQRRFRAKAEKLMSKEQRDEQQRIELVKKRIEERDQRLLELQRRKSDILQDSLDSREKKKKAQALNPSTTSSAGGGLFIYLQRNPYSASDPYDLIPVIEKPKGDLKINYDAEIQSGDRNFVPDLTDKNDFQNTGYVRTTGDALPVSVRPEKSKALKLKGKRPEDKKPGKEQGAPQRHFEYYTLSGQGLMLFVDDVAANTVNIPLEQWLLERQQFHAVSQLAFFKSFRQWKILKNWGNQIKSQRRGQVEERLRSNLFILDDTFREILCSHRSRCITMERLRTVDLHQQERSSYTIEEFKQKQKEVGERIQQQIMETSRQSSACYMDGVESIINQIKARQRDQEKRQKDDLEKYQKKEELAVEHCLDGEPQPRDKGEVLEGFKGVGKGVREQPAQRRAFPYLKSKKNNQFQINIINSHQSMKITQQKPLFEQLGFHGYLNYEIRNSLRTAFLKILRFAFLYDFIAMESLVTVQKLSIQECIGKLHRQVNKEILYELVDHEDNAGMQVADDGKALSQAEIPLFQAKCTYLKDKKIPQDSIYEVDVVQFVPPPLGKSRREEFNPTVHLEIESDGEEPEEAGKKPEQQAKDGENDDEESGASDESEAYGEANKEDEGPLYVPPTEEEMRAAMQLKTFKAQTIDNIAGFQLEIFPDTETVCEQIMLALRQGAEALQHFEKWSMHPNLECYDKALENWDPRSYEKWEREDDTSPYLDCEQWLEDDMMFQNLDNEIRKVVKVGISKVQKQLVQFNPLLLAAWENDRIPFQNIKDPKLKSPADVIPLFLDRFFSQKNTYENFIPEEKDLGLIMLNFDDVKAKLGRGTQHYINLLKKDLPRQLKDRVREVQTWLQHHIRGLDFTPQNVQEFVSQIQMVDQVEDVFDDYKEKLQLSDQLFTILRNIEGMLSREDINSIRIDETYQMSSVLTTIINDVKDQAVRNKNEMKSITKKKIPDLVARVQAFLQEIRADAFTYIHRGDPEAYTEDMLETLGPLQIQFDALQEDKDNIQDYQRTLEMENVEAFSEVEVAKQLIEVRQKLWKSLRSWARSTAAWRAMPFAHLDSVAIENIGRACTAMAKTALQCERGMAQNLDEDQPPSEKAKQPELWELAVARLKKIVWEFRDTMPVVEALGNELIEKIHWIEIKDIIGNHDFPLEEKNFTLGELIDLDVARFQDKLVVVSIKAQQEKKIQSQLDGLKAKWDRLDFDVINHKGSRDAFRIGSFEAVQQEIDESMVSLNLLISSQFVKRHQKQVDDFEARLNLIFELQELLKEFQRTWLYLDNIFLTPGADIASSRPEDYAEFVRVNQLWLRMMKQVSVQRNVRKNALQPRLNELKRWIESLAQISKNLDTYLEEKRSCFPRFYFISNDELLKILANAKDLREIEKHMSKCFENTSRFILVGGEGAEGDGGDLGEGQNEIFGVKSAEGEKLQFIKTIKMRANGIEELFKELERQSAASLQKKMREAYSDYYGTEELETERKDWVMSPKPPAQCIATIAQITWTEATELAINELTEEGNKFAVEDHLLLLKKQLSDLTELVRGDLQPIRRKILVALITQDVHQRDIVQALFGNDVQSCLDFQWQQQLRYYHESEKYVVRQVNAAILYAFEYMGPTSRLVITPLTDKCWMTITGAMHIQLGAAPAGPAGTGKTESTKDLAKACGIFCVVINCGEQIEYHLMAKLFSGVVMTGAWSCLDEFNRINLEVLSVIAQQLLDIRQAKLQNQETFWFNEKSRTLKPQAGVFVTMNPGYKGRVELPDNLKVLFRPVSMMIPNYEMIAEIMLFAEGFNGATILASKMVQLYRLASEQLSQQDHYDFGLRAVKSVLVMAGNLKRANAGLSENRVLIRAMRDSNLPKFLQRDLPLFEALIQDLFPGVSIPQTQNYELEAMLIDVCESKSLTFVPSIQKKALQLFDTLEVRFGVMLVGPTGGGKTTIYQLLAESMTRLRSERQSADQRFQNVKAKVLNPKAITMGELYGQVDPETSEWVDGLASKLLRKCSLPDSPRLTWCVFDGPVDAIWIENMNTVLDDNMTLCLVNGERIKLRHTTRMLFEVQDLRVASPATVSRCGMVYLTPDDLPWRPLLQSWMKTSIKAEGLLSEKQQEYLEELFENFVDVALEKLQKLKHMEVLTVAANQSIKCICNYLEFFIPKQGGSLQPNEKKQVWSRKLYSFFAFSMIWGLSSSYDRQGQLYLDSLFRELFSKLHLPKQDTVFQYYYDAKAVKFSHIRNRLPRFEYLLDAPYSTLFVPTVDSVMYSRLLAMLIKINKRSYFTGQTGVGKSILIQEYFRKNQASHRLSVIQMSLSAQTSSAELQTLILSKLEKKRGKKLLGAKGGNQCIIFVDDINMPMVEEYGAQPPIELLRQLIDTGHIYERSKFFKIKIDNYRLICAAAPPGGGRAHLSPRFMRHFHVINIPNASDETLESIFSTILEAFLRGHKFNPNTIKCSRTAVNATIDMYNQVNKHLLPIPSKFHYLFNLRDISKVFQGLLMAQPAQIPDEKVFLRLWAHECVRVFADRLCTPEDVTYFQDLLVDLLQVKFNERYEREQLFLNDYQRNKVTFSFILNSDLPDKPYEEVMEWSRLQSFLDAKVSEYNEHFKSQQMDLILFEMAIDHISRITRILNQPRGNAMLIGVSGCGKQSLTRLSAFLLEATSFQIKVSKSYKPQNFREDLKTRLMSSGCDRRPNVFILVDTQLIHNQFLEDINNLLNTGELANLYEKDDFEQMQRGLSELLSALGRGRSQEQVYQTYIEQLRENFHIILCMSPVGDQLRQRCRNFPSLVSCCTLDWFETWPKTALKTVAKQFLLNHGMIEKDELREKISSLFPEVHSCVDAYCLQLFNEQKRSVYLTPKTFLDALSLFKELLSKKAGELTGKLDRLKNGIQKLEVTNSQISELQKSLTELLPRLEVENENAKAQSQEIEVKQHAAQEREQETKAQTEQVTKEAEELMRLKRMSDLELDKAKPALMSAHKAVDELSRDHINELKQFSSPTPPVELTLRCTLYYLGEAKPDWPKAQKALADMRFLERLKGFNKNEVPDKILKKVNKLLAMEEFDLAKIQRASKAAGGLAQWCKALSYYAEAQKIVRPLLKQQAEMAYKSEQAQADVAQKQREIVEIRRQVQELEESYRTTVAYIDSLDRDKRLSEKRLSNAGKLVSLLADEGKRWVEEIGQIKQDLEASTSSVFLSVCQMSYLGPFTGSFRHQIFRAWRALMRQAEVEVTKDHSLQGVLSSQSEIRSWNIQGLPSDQVSIENAIFAMKCNKFPLLIDPQFQGLNWLRNRARSSRRAAKDYEILKMPKNDYSAEFQVASNNIYQKLQYSLLCGHQVIVEDLDATIDAGIDQLLDKAVYLEGTQKMIFFGARAVEYHDNFRLYLTTKLSNPHYLPETFIKSQIINFTVTYEGLDEQLLADVVLNLEPEVERQRDELVQDISKIQQELQALQTRILSELAESSQDTILDNDQLIETLDVSKTKSTEISASLVAARVVEATIDQKRNLYRRISNRGAVMFFVAAALSQVDSMYQYSLDYVKKIFNETIVRVLRRLREVALERDLEPDIDDTNLVLIKHITERLYENVCQGLFERHKVLFSFLICAAIQLNSKAITQDAFNLLVRGPPLAFDRSGQLTYANQEDIHDFVTEAQWDESYCMQLTCPETFKNFSSSLLLNKAQWKKFIGDPSGGAQKSKVEDAQRSVFHGIPRPYDSVSSFEKLLIVRLLKPQHLIPAIKEYVSQQLSKQFAQTSASSIETIFGMSDKTTPIIFILSQGADPNEQILNHAKQKGFGGKLFQKSLGQGQKEIAANLIQQGREEGNWVLLQNCHLFQSWMPQLENIVGSFKDEAATTDDGFRLILTSMPCDYFPQQVLQNGLKITTEPPSGLKAGLRRTFTNIIDREVFDSSEAFLTALEVEREQLKEARQQALLWEEQQALQKEKGSSLHSDPRTSVDKPQISLEELMDKSLPGYRPSLQEEFCRLFDLSDTWKSLLVGLGFFHSVIQERRKFGSLGWNITYEFNDSDIDSSIKMLKNFIFEAEKIPFDSMIFMTGFINYGGRVTDDNDRTLLVSLLENCYGPKLLDPNLHEELFFAQEVAKLKAAGQLIPAKSKNKQLSRAQQEKHQLTKLLHRRQDTPFEFKFFGNSAYSLPRKRRSHEDIHSYIESLPDVDVPEIFGMHQNARSRTSNSKRID